MAALNTYLAPAIWEQDTNLWKQTSKESAGLRRRNQTSEGRTFFWKCCGRKGQAHIFGNPGTTELPLIDALVTAPDIRYVWGLQEATAVSMADGYAQASGKPAFVNLHTAGGLGHGMGAIMNAKIARVPMIITAGQQDLRHFLADPLLAADLVGMAAPIAKWCYRTKFAR